MKMKKSRTTQGPSSSLGLVSFSESSKSLIRITPEIVLVSALVFGIVILIIKMSL